MSYSSQAMLLLLKLAKREVDVAAEQLAKAHRAVNESKAQKEQLLFYRHEYVVKNAVPAVEIIHNGNIVAGCLKTGAYSIPTSGTTANDNTITYENLETKLTNRFDNVTFYNSIDGGTP
jgi:hypothetical protein